MPTITEVSPIELMRQFNEAEAPRVSADLAAEQANAARLFSLPAEMIEAPSITLCSVWPEAMESQPFHHGGVGRKVYPIAAGSPENPSYLVLKNTWDWTIAQEGVGERGDRQVMITAGMVAIDIIKYWTGDHPGNRKGKIGIGIIRGEYNPTTKRMEATASEVEDLVKQQRGFLTYVVERCDEAWDHGKREYSFHQGRKAIKMLGLDLTQHPWFRSKVQLFNDCPNCAEKVAVNAIFCKTCRQSITDFFVSRNLTPDRAQWPKVVDDMERLTQPEAKPSKSK